MKSDEWINAMASRLAHLHDVDEASVWDAVPAVFSEVMGRPCDKADGYDITLAGAVVETVKRARKG